MSETGPGRRVRTAEYVASPASVGAARRDAAEALRDWGLPKLVDTAALLVSELVTNAVKATGRVHERPGGADRRPSPCVMLQLRAQKGELAIYVWDDDTRAPALEDAAPSAESGRGLRLVDALSRRWGHYAPDVGGKIVWCEVALR